MMVERLLPPARHDGDRPASAACAHAGAGTWHTWQGLAARLAALLSERDLLRSGRDPDMRSRLELLRGEMRNVDPGALARVRDLARRLGSEGSRDANDDSSAGAVLAWAYPDRVAQLRAGSGGAAGQRYLLANGRGAILDQASTLMNAQFLVALDLDDAEGSEARIRLAAPLTREHLDASLRSQIAESVETDADPRNGALRARRVRRLDALVLEERRVELAPEDAARALLAQVQRQGLDVLPWGEAGTRLRARLQFVTAHAGSSVDWLSSDDAALLADLEQWLGPWLHGISRLEQLGAGRLAEALLSRYTHAQRKLLDEFAPTHVTVPTGTRLRWTMKMTMRPASKYACRKCSVLPIHHVLREGGCPSR